jgi:hypothetical protein
MSLEELLRKPESASAWSRQRRKLFRLALGILISTVALLGGIFSALSFRNASRSATQNDPAAQSELQKEKDAEVLAELMRVQKEANNVRNELKFTGARRRPGPVLRVSNYDPGEGFETLRKVKHDLYIPTGAVFQAQLLTPIKTSIEKTFVMAETTNEFRMDMKRRILPASRLIGRSHFDPILKAVVVEFNTLVSPAGIESSMSGLALSRNALPEIEGLYFSDKLVNYGTALAFGFLSGFAEAGRERGATIFGSQPEVSIGNQVLSGLSVASFQVANQILNDIRARSIEYVVVPAGERIFVVLTRRYDIAQNGSQNADQ